MLKNHPAPCRVFAFLEQGIVQSSAWIACLKPVDKPVYKLSSDCEQVGYFRKSKNYPESIHRQASRLPSEKSHIQVYENKT